MLIARGIAASIGDADQRRLRRRAARRRDRDRARAARAGAGDRRRARASSPPRFRRATRRASIRCRRCRRASIRSLSAGESRVRAIAGGGARRRVDRLPVGRRRRAPVFYAGYVLAIVVGAAARPAALAGAGASAPAAAEVAAAGRGRAGGRQPDPGAAPDVGERRRADAVARAGRRVCRHGARQLRLDHRLDGHGAQPRPVRHAVAEHRRSARSGFPPTMAPELAAMPGVERVQMVRDARIVFRQTPVMIVAVDIASIARDGARASRSPATPTTMYRRTAAGEGLMVSDNLAQLQRLTLGEMLEIPAPHGVIRLPIVGIVVDYSDQQGTILMDRTRLPALLARRLGERLPRLPDAGRAGARGEAADPRALRRASGRCSC